MFGSFNNKALELKILEYRFKIKFIKFRIDYVINHCMNIIIKF